MSGRLLLLAAFIALIAVLVEWRLFDREVTTPAGDAERPGYYLTGINLEDFGADGNPRLALQAATADEEPVSGAVTLREVVVDYQSFEGQSWRLTSAEARVPRGAVIVEFEGDVRMSGQVGELPEPGEMRTARLILDTAEEHARTRAAVTLSFGRHIMHARGLRVDLKEGRLRLESNVHGLFIP